MVPQRLTTITKSYRQRCYRVKLLSSHVLRAIVLCAALLPASFLLTAVVADEPLQENLLFAPSNIEATAEDNPSATFDNNRELQREGRGVLRDRRDTDAGHSSGGGSYRRRAVSERCVFVLGTGRSGSTSLMDALNQLPHYMIRGEQGGAFWCLYMTWRLLGMSWTHSINYIEHIKKVEEQYGEHAAGYVSFGGVKKVYDKYAAKRKLPWFNDLHPERMKDAVRSFYAHTYGYHGPGYVSGFKEIRFGRGRVFPPNFTYEDFAQFMQFLNLLCDDAKIVLNSRASDSLEGNARLADMLKSTGVLVGNSTFEDDLAATHEWYDRYVSEHPDHAFRVMMEDMFDAKKNVTLTRKLLAFLGEDPKAEISFERMPRSSGGAKTETQAARRVLPEADRDETEGASECQLMPLG